LFLEPFQLSRSNGHMCADLERWHTVILLKPAGPAGRVKHAPNPRALCSQTGTYCNSLAC
jgi:hypothetical protein